MPGTSKVRSGKAQRAILPGAVSFPSLNLQSRVRARMPRGCLRSGAVMDRVFPAPVIRSEEHTSELQSLMRISYAVFCLKNKITFFTIALCCTSGRCVILFFQYDTDSKLKTMTKSYI